MGDRTCTSRSSLGLGAGPPFRLTALMRLHGYTRSYMHERWTTRYMDRMMLYGPCLPLELTHRKGRPRWARMLGLLWFAVWVIPAALLCTIPLLFLLFSDIVLVSWYGEF